MSRDDHQKVKKIFQLAADLAPEERGVFLDEECAGDDDLRCEVERLLDAEDSKFLKEPAVAQVAEDIADASESEPTRSFDSAKDNDRVGHFRIISKIGSGGMGEVFLAQDTELGRRVAVKFLSSAFSRDTDKLNRFIQEAKAASALNHPNILTIHEIGQTDGRRFIASEFIEGKTLREILAQEDPIPLKTILRIAIQIAEALSAAHSAGIIHRDIKPENVMVRNDGYVKVLDFGLAKLAEPPEIVDGSDIDKEASTHLRVRTDTGMVMGTASYMSPEQTRGKEVDERTDIFSFGVVLFEMVTGTAPFKGETLTDLLVAIVEKEPPPIARFAPDTPAELQQMISKSLRKDKDERYQTMKSLLADLKTLKAEMEFTEKLERTGSPEERDELKTKGSENQNTKTRKARQTVTKTSGSGNLFRDRKVAIAGMIGVVVAAAAVAYYFYSNTAAAPLTVKDVILITDFDNKTGEEIFDGTLRQALTMSLQQSPFLSIFPDSEVQNTLKLMKRDSDSKITGELAREICQRRGLKAYVNGTLSRLGSGYVLGLEAVNARTGETIASVQTEDEVADQKNVLGLISRAATEIRSKLGESLTQIEKFDKPLAEMTTSSLEALEAYSMGKEANGRGDPKLAILQLKRAIEIDPDFASAYKSLSNHYWTVGELELSKGAAKEAYLRRNGVSEFERLEITGAYYLNVEYDSLKGIEVYETEKAAFPRSSTNILASEYATIGEIEKAVLNWGLDLERDPNKPHAYTGLFSLYLLDQRPKAQEMLTKIEEKIGGRALGPRLRLAFLANDKDEIARLLEESGGSPVFRLLVSRAGGRWNEVRTLARSTIGMEGGGKEWRSGFASESALTASAFKKCSDAKEFAARSLAIAKSIYILRDLGLALANCGEHDKARTLLAELNEEYPNATILNFMTAPAVRAVIALQTGKPEEAIAILEIARKYERGNIDFWIPYLRAEAFSQLGRLKEAENEYQKILRYPGEKTFSPLKPLAQLGKARVTKSKKEYEKFFEMWKDADKDLPDLIAGKKEYAALN